MKKLILLITIAIMFMACSQNSISVKEEDPYFKKDQKFCYVVGSSTQLVKIVNDADYDQSTVYVENSNGEIKIVDSVYLIDSYYCR